jgi:hypothetical protein
MPMHAPPLSAAAFRQLVLARLAPPDRVVFLAESSWTLTIATRGAYPRPARPADTPVGRFVCQNEVLHILTDQLRADLRNRGFRFPEDALVSALDAKAGVWRCRALLHAAFGRAAGSSEPGSSNADVLRGASVHLNGRGRSAFLARLGTELTTAQALSTPDEHGSQDAEIGRLRCLNDVQSLLLTVLRDHLDGHGDTSLQGEPFLTRVLETARTGGCAEDVGGAFLHALSTSNGEAPP